MAWATPKIASHARPNVAAPEAPRPDILHRARKNAFGKGYEDMITRLRLKQAYGRLLRRADDKGVFIMLDGMLPTRLTSAFPKNVEVKRLGLAEAIERTREFLDD